MTDAVYILSVISPTILLGYARNFPNNVQLLLATVKFSLSILLSVRAYLVMVSYLACDGCAYFVKTWNF